MNEKYARRLWWFGNVLSTVCCALMWHKYGFAAGFTTLTVIGVLVDIRCTLMLD